MNAAEHFAWAQQQGLAGPRVEAPPACGVYGDLVTEALPPNVIVLGNNRLGPCEMPATELVRFRCEKGHERERKACPAHVDVLTRPRPDEQAYCVICFEAERIESRLTPLVEVPDRPPAPQHWRGEAAKS